jgi:uncharacterized Rmd1/YagE family protein
MQAHLNLREKRQYKKEKEMARVRAYPVCTSDTSNPIGSALQKVHNILAAFIARCHDCDSIFTSDMSKKRTLEIRKSARRQEVEFL